MELHEALARIRIEQGPEWLNFPEPKGILPKRLFHYTSQAGLLGILTGKILWATNVLYLNDSSELTYGPKLAREIIAEVRHGTRSPIVLEFFDRGERLLDLANLYPNRQYYASCFCEKPDLLSQWRAYGDRGGGVALGFDMERLTKAAIKHGLSLYPVDYGATRNSLMLKNDIMITTKALENCLAGWPGREDVLIAAACEHLKLALLFRLF